VAPPGQVEEAERLQSEQQPLPPPWPDYYPDQEENSQDEEGQPRATDSAFKHPRNAEERNAREKDQRGHCQFLHTCFSALGTIFRDLPLSQPVKPGF